MFGREPTLILGLVRAVVVAVTAFGLDLTVEQVAATYLVAEAALSLFNRHLVTPVDPDAPAADGALDPPPLPPPLA